MALLDADGNVLPSTQPPKAASSSIKVVICFPTRGDCKAGFTLDLARLVNLTVRSRPDIRIALLNAGGLLLHDLRSLMAKQALEGGADYLFWLDDDMRFPPDSLIRLLGHDRDIVGANYITRNLPPRPTALHQDESGEKFWHVASPEGVLEPEEVSALGFGCLLMHARVFENLPQPWFSMPYHPGKGTHVGEDVYFCANARGAGFSTFCDHALSREIGHIGAFEYRWEHFDALTVEAANELPASGSEVTSDQ